MVFVDIIGAGRIGHGIAVCVAANGFRVRLRDVKDRPLGMEDVAIDRAKRLVGESVSFLKQADLLDDDEENVLKRIQFVRGYEGVEEAFHVVEAVPENLKAKAEVFAELNRKLSPDVLLASTSSSIRPSTMAQLVRNPERFLVTHWINPAELIPLVEISPCPHTSSKTVEEVLEFLERCGKTPVVCGDSPGYVSARLQATLMNEALRIVEEGVASPEDVDKALRNGIGFRLYAQGLLEFLDWGGLDILYDVDKYLSSELGDRFNPPNILKELVEKGFKGVDAGRGIYDYSKTDVAKLRKEIKMLMARRLREMKYFTQK